MHALGTANDMYGNFEDAKGIVGSIQEILTLDKSIRAMKGISSMKKERRKALRDLIVVVGKMVGTNLISLLDPTGLAIVAQSYTFSKCMNENYYWFVLADDSKSLIDDDELDERLQDDRIPPANGTYDSPVTDDGAPPLNNDGKGRVIVSLDDDNTVTSKPTHAPTNYIALIDGSGKVMQSQTSIIGRDLTSIVWAFIDSPECNYLRLAAPLQRVKFTVESLIYNRSGIGIGHWNWTW